MSETVTPARRGRDSRRARAQSIAVKYPYIRRRLKPVELLSSEAIEVIEANAETWADETVDRAGRGPLVRRCSAILVIALAVRRLWWQHF